MESIFIAQGDEGVANLLQAVIPRRSARGITWLRSLMRGMQGVMHQALPLPAVLSQQARTAEPHQDTVRASSHNSHAKFLLNSLLVDVNTILTWMRMCWCDQGRLHGCRKLQSKLCADTSSYACLLHSQAFGLRILRFNKL